MAQSCKTYLSYERKKTRYSLNVLDVYINFTVNSTVAEACLHVSQYMNSGTHSLMRPRLTSKNAAFKPVTSQNSQLAATPVDDQDPAFHDT